jgi:Domain of unknown function (DUF4062)
MFRMPSVFISSVQAGFEDVRAAARRGIESLGYQPVMAETSGASADSPQRALLDRVAAADIFLLLVGPRYGTRQASGFSATEDEFNEARRLGKPILVLRQDVELESEQEEFLRRATGGWEQGKLYDSFQDASDVGLKVVQALTNLRDQGDRAALEPEAQRIALELANAGQRGGYGHGGPLVRVVLVPLLGHGFIDAVALDDRELPEEIAGDARSARLVPQSESIRSSVSAAGFSFAVGGEHGSGLTLSVGRKGEIVAEARVGGEGDFGFSLVVPERIRAAVEAAAAFAESVWQRIDQRGEVQAVAVTLAVPDAQMKNWGAGQRGNSMSFAGTFRMPEIVVAPQPPLVVRRQDLGRPETVERLLAELRRVFADAGALAEGC